MVAYFSADAKGDVKEWSEYAPNPEGKFFSVNPAPDSLDPAAVFEMVASKCVNGLCCETSKDFVPLYYVDENEITRINKICFQIPKELLK